MISPASMIARYVSSARRCALCARAAGLSTPPARSKPKKTKVWWPRLLDLHKGFRLLPWRPQVRALEREGVLHPGTADRLFPGSPAGRLPAHLPGAYPGDGFFAACLPATNVAVMGRGAPGSPKRTWAENGRAKPVNCFLQVGIKAILGAPVHNDLPLLRVTPSTGRPAA